MTKTAVMICALIALASQWANAQPLHERFQGSFFPPDLVMQNQQTLGLTEDQKTYFKSEISQAQARFTELQWKLESEMEKMILLANQPKVSESQITAQMDKVLGLEREIKLAQMTLIIRIKNKLTAEQQARLREIRSKPAVK